MDRSLRIASDYGERIGKSNLKPKALERLLAGYPSHSFVIDREEAGEIFEKVEEPSEELRRLAEVYEHVADYYETHAAPFCFFLSDPMPKEQQAAEGEVNTTGGEQKSSESGSIVTHSPNGAQCRQMPLQRTIDRVFQELEATNIKHARLYQIAPIKALPNRRPQRLDLKRALRIAISANLSHALQNR